ncbi:hypothetical protein [uncultured Roseibium sp.]|uniref:hypothetical protein n=1 Tax=uncultured Roseibium sp. TaxID=1936171 RepID=UPI00260B4931|nr:hypothetical protein [uncultured Roseibium sp.]
MPFFSPRGPVSHAAAEAFAKGVKRGMAPESRIPSSERKAEAQTRRAEEPPTSATRVTPSRKKTGFLSRLKAFFLR